MKDLKHCGCRSTDACFTCGNSRFKSLFRGNVAVDCKKEFFMKHLRLGGRHIQRLVSAFLAGLASFL